MKLFLSDQGTKTSRVYPTVLCTNLRRWSSSVLGHQFPVPTTLVHFSLGLGPRWRLLVSLGLMNTRVLGQLGRRITSTTSRGRGKTTPPERQVHFTECVTDHIPFRCYWLLSITTIVTLRLFSCLGSLSFQNMLIWWNRDLTCILNDGNIRHHVTWRFYL